MKKYVMYLTLVVLLAFGLSVAAFATEAAASYSLAADVSDVQPGQQVVVTVTVNTNAGEALAEEIAYDPAALQYVSHSFDGEFAAELCGADAAVAGKVDNLVGFKENVITGHLIPAGTGTAKMQSIRLKYLGTEIEPELPAQETEKSYEDIAAEWRDADSEDEDMLPDEAKELIVDDDLEGFNEEI